MQMDMEDRLTRGPTHIHAEIEANHTVWFSPPAVCALFSGSMARMDGVIVCAEPLYPKQGNKHDGQLLRSFC